MSRIKYAILAAMALAVVFFLSCSKVDEAIDDAQNIVEHGKCAVSQGEWDATKKKCIKCSEGMSMEGGLCVAAATSEIENEDGSTTILCPPKTKLAGSRCVADVIATDTNAVAGKFYCDYGNLDPNEVDFGIGCFSIEYEEECDQEWGLLVKSCNAADRRKDTPTFCDYGPVDPKHGGGCYRILDNGSDCDLEWGIKTDKCGTNAKWPGGTICPGDKIKVLDECRKASDIGDRNSTYCDYGPFVLNKLDEVEGGCWRISTQEDRDNCLRWGKGVNSCPTYSCPAGTIGTSWGSCEKSKSSSSVNSSSSVKSSSSVVKSSSSETSGSPLYCDYGYIHSSDSDLQLDEGGGCYEIKSENQCDLDWGKFVNSCKEADRRKDMEYCDYGPWNEYGGGCWPIINAEVRAACDLQWATIVKKCAWLNP